MSAQALHRDQRLRGPDLRSLLLVRYGFACCWCGAPLAATDACCCVEHLVPAARGGPRTMLANLAPTHRKCNAERGVLPLSEWVWLCARRGRRPNRPAIARALYELADIAPTDVARAYAVRELRCMQQDDVDRKVA